MKPSYCKYCGQKYYFEGKEYDRHIRQHLDKNCPNGLIQEEKELEK